MAYPVSRSCVRDLHAGLTDGTYKKAAPNRGGIVEDTFAHGRKIMCGVWHGFNESSVKVLPNGKISDTPYYFDVAPRFEESV